MKPGHTLTSAQTSRVDRLLWQWNNMRGDVRREASREELIDYLLQREEDELGTMAGFAADDAQPASLPCLAVTDRVASIGLSRIMGEGL